MYNLMLVDSKRADDSRPSRLRFRTPTVGREDALVREYVLKHLPGARPGHRRTVFLEPELDAGYPDLVVAYWSESIASSYSSARAALVEADLRLIHHLQTLAPATTPTMRAVHGEGFDSSLQRLAEADLVYRRGVAWHARSLNRTFALRKLVAIEAKIGDWRRGLWQAVRNTWFASESYLLVPEVGPESGIESVARQLGVGVLVSDRPLSDPIVPSTRLPLPRSYASWQFNEWAWRIWSEDGPA
jgi:hypothetical protein